MRLLRMPDPNRIVIKPFPSLALSRSGACMRHASYNGYNLSLLLCCTNAQLGTPKQAVKIVLWFGFTAL